MFPFHIYNYPLRESLLVLFYKWGNRLREFQQLKPGKAPSKQRSTFSKPGQLDSVFGKGSVTCTDVQSNNMEEREEGAWRVWLSSAGGGNSWLEDKGTPRHVSGWMNLAYTLFTRCSGAFHFQFLPNLIIITTLEVASIFFIFNH